MGRQTLFAQDLSLFKEVSDSSYLSSPAYSSGNKYQKDALLFLDLVTDTHPYFIRAERRAAWLAQKEALLNQCVTIQTDEAFVDALNNYLGSLYDGHCFLATLNRLLEGRQMQEPSLENRSLSAETETAPILQRHDLPYVYQLFPEMRLCYLQFNQCRDSPDKPFATFLDEMFGRMEADGIRSLVVDVQYNGGGDSRLCNQLLDHLCPWNKMKDYTVYVRFSDWLKAYYPQIADLQEAWEKSGHSEELYFEPDEEENDEPEDFQQPEIFDGQVVFIMGKQTYSSAGILLTLARDNHIGTIIGTTSRFSPSHYGDILPFRLPNTGVLGAVPFKYFARPDETLAEEPDMKPDIEVNLDDMESSWRYICENYGAGKS